MTQQPAPRGTACCWIDIFDSFLRGAVCTRYLYVCVVIKESAGKKRPLLEKFPAFQRKLAAIPATSF
jgi:hypothetical protein